MGTFTYAAGISRPPELKPFPAARDNLRATDNRFNDYLEEARAPKPEPERKTDRAEDARKPEESEKPQPESEAEASGNTDNVEPTVDEAVAQQAASDANVTLALVGAEQSVVDSIQSSTAATDANISNDSSGEARGDVSNIAKRANDSTGSIQQAQANVKDSQSVESAPVAPQISNQATRLEGSRQQVNAAPTSTADTQATSDKSASAQSQSASNPNAAATQLPGQSETGAERTDSNQQAVQSYSEQASRPTRAETSIDTTQPSLFDQKVAAAKTAERLGQSGYVVPGAPTDGSNRSFSQARESASPVPAVAEADPKQANSIEKRDINTATRWSKLLSEALGTADKNRSTGSIKSARGDSAALSTFRLLTDGAIDTTRGPSGGNNTQQVAEASGSTSTSQSVSSRGVNTPNNPGQIVGQLLNASVEKADGAEALARLLNASSVPGRHQATLRLDPPELGQVNIRIDLKHEGLSLQVHAESRDVARLLESRLTDLRDTLATHGIRIERTDVVVQSNAAADAQLNDSTTDEQSDATTFADSHESNAQRDSQDAQRTNGRQPEASLDDEEGDDGATTTITSSVSEHHDQSLLSETAVNLVA